MAVQRKLSKRASLRKALLRNQVTQLLWSGHIETTLARAKEVQPLAERLITLAVRDYDKTVEVTKEFNNDKGQLVTETFTNDAPEKLASRRRIMSFCYDLPDPKKDDETKADYKERTKDIKHPLVEKMFREYGPKYRARKEETGTGGGYTRILRKGPRRGDGAEMVILELV
jgi:large subunit ribosomal protein L17